MKGIVLWYSKRDQHGIIVADNGSEFYFDVSVLHGRVELDKRSNVTFEHNTNIPDCRCAKNVRLVGEVNEEIAK